MECCLKSDYIIRNNTATFASYGQEEENKKYDNYIRGFEPGIKTSGQALKWFPVDLSRGDISTVPG